MQAGNRGNGKVVAELDSYPSALNEQARRGLRRSVQSAPLIGREAELAAVLRLVADPSVRLVSLVGRGGVGKTRLALEVAWTLDAGQPGSVGVVSLASVPAPQLVAAEIADQLQITIPQARQRSTRSPVVFRVLLLRHWCSTTSSTCLLAPACSPTCWTRATSCS